MDNKVKYTWQLMHGDADHYDNESLTLSNPNDIVFFDYITNLSFDCWDGLIFDDEDDIEEGEDPPRLLFKIKVN
ncbi:MAG: hypothetical protein N2250_09380 [Pseudothermotoga sp.]|nr:hypothetical protein [Pseudothermotoga sp.]